MATAVAAAPSAHAEGAPNRTAALRRIARDPGAVVGAVIVALVALCALFAPLIARGDPNAQDLASTLLPPMWIAGGSHAHVLGTDNLGRDVLVRIIWGSRISAIVGISVVAIGASIGVTAGLLAGYRRGWVDALIARITDVQLAFPLVLLAVAIVAVVGPGLWTVIAAIGLTSWVQYVRVVRAETLSLREREFVAAAHAAGASSARVLVRHLLPNVGSAAIVLGTFEIARAVVLESSLSFLGLGVPPTIASWGGMLADGRQYLDTAWWIALFPGLAIVIAVMGVNLLGDGLRDALDPGMR
ncbi:peptide ABC transporter permease [Vulcanimicrobium alpinum]|uniref:Peptide ABC transporter permease n=1 Tax=Vulcanimicrobium alpinum TaxID=3016050 RepID=A0AAN1XWJ2_UNVUL|nr:ABC transporter permease [Vulcanimicrobium alpinum]BDE05603.1 peptide ABC transporter permease [Vulcanimicrobium alpinum]